MPTAANVTSINSSKLIKPQVAPRVGSVMSPHRQSVAETLSPQRLGRIMAAADEGDVEAYLTLAEEMEEREPHYFSVLQTRKMAVSGTRPSVEAPKDSDISKEITDWVDQRIVRRPEFEGLVLDLMDGVPKGFSCCEILWQRDEREWWPGGYRFTPQRYFAFDEDTMTQPMLRTDDDAPEPLRPYSWLVHRPKIRSGIPIRVGLARTIAVCYAAKRWTVADWLAFLDIYGVPMRIGKYPVHMKELKKQLLKAVRALGSDAAAVIPKEMEIELVETKSGATSGAVFREKAEYWDKQTSKAVLGQTMTTDDGSSLAQSKIHENTKFEIRDSDSRAVCATINRDLVKVAVDLNFGPQKAYPEVAIRQKRPEDIKVKLEGTKLFVDMGGRVQMSEVRDVLGWSEPEEGAELLQPAARMVAGAKPKETPNAGDNTRGEQVGEDEDIDVDPRQLNRERFRRRDTFDAVDDEVDERLEDDWRELADPNIGEAIRAMQAAPSYEEARAILEQLRRDHGDRLDIEALVLSLSRATYKLRGIGDATDAVKP